ncbi:RICIN domain-containing protein [Streptomyces sp. NBS 14/10]|uniref:RICIN domain-containing protein n=1 Tax=Streptomyces sp. NBS 14/10 TaxID=1945643 RepID=UPI0015C65761|nr:RICIN domain-containing protein [Streptomyces sp. NBS 14/10]
MPSQEPTNPKGPAVRRAVTLSGTAGTPDPSALTPLGAERTEPGAAGAVGAAAETDTAEQPKVSLKESASAGESVESAPSVTPGAAGATAESTGATAASAAGAPDTPAAPDVPPAEADGHADGHGSADGMASAEGDYPPGADTGAEEDEPPSGRPTKALLAAAAIAGALLISLPFLAFGADDDDDKTEAAPEPTSGMTVPKDEEKGPGTYTAQSPAPIPTKKSESPSPEAKPRSEPSSEQPKSQPEPDPSSEQPKPRAKKVVPAGKSYVIAPDQRTNFQLKNVSTGRCADLPGLGKGKLDGPALQHDCLNDWDADNQVWDFVLAQKNKGPDGRNLVVIKNRKSGLCLDLPGRGSQPSRTGLNQTYCNRTLDDNQLWWVENLGGNRTFWIHNYASDQRCLEVWGEKPDFGGNDARLGIYKCSTTDDHEWRLMSKGES